MKRNAKQKMCFLALSGLAVFGMPLNHGDNKGLKEPHTLENIPTLVKKAEDNSASSSSTPGSNVSSNTNTETVENGKIIYNGDAGKIYVEYDDKNGNGIPDAVEKYMGDKDIDDTWKLIFQCCVSGVSLAFTLIYCIFAIRKKLNKMGDTAKEANANVIGISGSVAKNAKQIQVNNENTTKQIEATTKLVNDSIAKTTDNMNELTNKVSDSEKRMTALVESNEELRRSNEELSKGYASLNSMVTKVLENQALMANTSENFANGTYKAVSDNVKGAKAYGEQEKAKSQEKQS